MKVTSKVPVLRNNECALSRKFLNGIGPEPLKRLLKNEAEDFLITSISEFLNRLTELLPEYHRPYSKNYLLLPGQVIGDYPDPNCRVSQANRKPRRNYNLPTHKKVHNTRSRTQLINSVVESINKGLKKDCEQDATYYSRHRWNTDEKAFKLKNACRTRVHTCDVQF
ncbi:hypothetical protein P9112_005218 [Eukaryota sp. TZLM1-RC]